MYTEWTYTMNIKANNHLKRKSKSKKNKKLNVIRKLRC